MTPAELQSQPWQYLGTVGVVRDIPNVPALLVQGVNGASEYAVGLHVNGRVVLRLPGESIDDMTARVRRDMTLRGDPSNEAVTLYNPHVPAKPIRLVQPRFQNR